MVTEASALVAWYLCLRGMTFKVMVKVFICVASEELSGKLFCMWISELQKRGDIEDNYVAPQPPPPPQHTHTTPTGVEGGHIGFSVDPVSFGIPLFVPTISLKPMRGISPNLYIYIIGTSLRAD